MTTGFWPRLILRAWAILCATIPRGLILTFATAARGCLSGSASPSAGRGCGCKTLQFVCWMNPLPLWINGLRLTTWLAGRTAIIATHRVPILQLTDRTMILQNGRLTVDGPRDQVLAHMRGTQNKAAS